MAILWKKITVSPMKPLNWSSVVLFLTVLGSLYSAPAPTRAWIESRVQEIQPTAKDKRFDDIGWAEDIRTAKALALQHQRPIFLFTHDGRMNLGRC